MGGGGDTQENWKRWWCPTKWCLAVSTLSSKDFKCVCHPSAHLVPLSPGHCPTPFFVNQSFNHTLLAWLILRYNDAFITCIGGLAGLVLCLYAKLHKHYMEKKERKKDKELKDKVRQAVHLWQYLTNIVQFTRQTLHEYFNLHDQRSKKKSKRSKPGMLNYWKFTALLKTVRSLLLMLITYNY